MVATGIISPPEFPFRGLAKVWSYVCLPFCATLAAGDHRRVAPLTDDRLAVFEEVADVGAGQKNHIGVYEEDVIAADVAVGLELGDLLADVVFAEARAGDLALGFQEAEMLFLAFGHPDDDLIPALKVAVNRL